MVETSGSGAESRRPGTQDARPDSSAAEGTGRHPSAIPLPELSASTLRPESAASFVDDETGSTWDILDTFWFANAAFAPATRPEP
jgi:hypothetical protein